VKEQVYEIISFLATIAYFVPALIVIFKKLWKDPYFLYLGLYWLAGAVVNIVTRVPGAPSEVIAVLYNMFDIPFMLWILWYTSFSTLLAKILRVIIAVYIIIELLLVFRLGVNYDAIKYIMGIGVLVVVIALVWEITLYIQRLEHSNREKAMLFIYAALLFEYGTYTVVYVFDYFLKPGGNDDTRLIYYTSSLIAISIACFGFLLKKTKKSLVFEQRTVNSE
jgi:hypothetical protein